MPFLPGVNPTPEYSSDPSSPWSCMSVDQQIDDGPLPKPFNTHHLTFPPLPTPSISGAETPISLPSLLKRKRPSSTANETSADPPQAHSTNVQFKGGPNIQFKEGQLTCPRSQYLGWTPPLSVIPESRAINELRLVWNAGDRSQDSHNIWVLEDFCIYRVESDFRLPGELVPLHHFNVEKRVNEALFDGTLIADGERRRVHGASFSCLTVEGYNDRKDNMSICIQSELGSRANVWYELGTPAKEYVRYHEPYLWLARFGKYFFEWISEFSKEKVTLKLFRAQFFTFVALNYHKSKDFQDWYSKYGSRDFRQALCANVGYLFKECWNLDVVTTKHPIWDEIDPQRLKAIPKQPSIYDQTVVTPFVFDCFHDMAFASQLQVLHHNSNPALTHKRHTRRHELGLTPLDCKPSGRPDASQFKVAGAIRQGDVVCVDAEKNTRWKTNDNSQWYAYVQNSRVLRSGVQKLDVIWMYEPCDTTLGQEYYPWGNELFFSDNCSCGKDALDATDVRFKVQANWFVGNPESQTCFFVRKKFRTEHTFGAYDFVQLNESDFRCSCFKDSPSDIAQLQQDVAVGDAVLVQDTFDGKNILEPARVLQFLDDSILLQKFSRCRRDLGDISARTNQIHPKLQPQVAQPAYIARKCNIATLSSAQNLPSPYDRDGAGDLWFVVDPEAADSNETSRPETRMKGMGIFCGGGSFDRGLEDGGGVDFKWGIDWAQHALHTYRANLDDPDQMHLWLGSVNDYLAKAIYGSSNKLIASVGEVDMLAAGSPCPGFSKLQQNKTSQQSLRNCSLVASVCSYVDFYMPLYLFLENVTGMATTSKGDQNVFSQILCCLVAMGYQVQQFLMDPGHFGSCQSRSRIFIVATAPGLAPLQAPPQTHSCPRLQHGKSIGTSSNGLPFGRRRNDVCPFSFLSAKDAFNDLPDISEGHVQTCIPYPDHKLCRHEDADKRTLISSVPRWPYGQGFMQAYHAGLMPEKQIHGYAWQNKSRAHPGSKSWSRVHPDRLVPCLTTIVKPHDAWVGRILHYDQPRILSVMEARRVQSFLDEEVIVGIPTRQWKIIGNSVDRKVSFALGLRLAEAWKSSKTRTLNTAEVAVGQGESTQGEKVQEESATKTNERDGIGQASNGQAGSTFYRRTPSSSSSEDSDDTVPIGCLVRRVKSFIDRTQSGQPVVESNEAQVAQNDNEYGPMETEEAELEETEEVEISETNASWPAETEVDQTETTEAPAWTGVTAIQTGEDRRCLRGSSAKLVVPTNSARRPERADTSFL